MTDRDETVNRPTGLVLAAKTIAWSGLVAGTLDLAYAVGYTLYLGGSATGVLRFIAGGMLGPEALKGGLGTALLGVCLHFLIAYGAAAIFYGASRWFTVLTSRPVIAGLLYGAGVWLVMNLLILRWSAWHVTKFPPANPWPIFVAHLLCVGLPIALNTAHGRRSDAWKK